MLFFMSRQRSSWTFFVLLLTLITVSGTAIFFFLHYLGNRIIPYDLALERFKSIETELTNEEYERGYSSSFEICQIGSIVLRGAKSVSDAEGHSLRNAVILQLYGPGECDTLRAMINGDNPDVETLKTRHWWGNKAIYAIGLRFLSLSQLRQVVEIATYLAYGVLLATLMMLMPRAALAMIPVAVFGIFSSGIKYFADVSNGVPYLWAVLMAAILSLLMRWRPDGFGVPVIVQKVGTVPTVFCFVAGMVSSYLFFFDGHHIYTIVLIGLVAWFGSLDRSTRDRAKRAALFVVFYISGFVACFVLGQVIKGVVYELSYDEESVFSSFLGGIDNIKDGYNMGEPLALINGLSLFWTIGTGSIATDQILSLGQALSLLSLLALAVAVSVAIFRGCRGYWDLLWDILFILALMAVVSLWLLFPNDILGKSSRFFFINYGLMWSCFILAIKRMSWRLDVIIGGFSPLLIWLWLQFDRVEPANERLQDVYESIADDKPLFHDVFDVYLSGNNDSLIYVKEQCRLKDIEGDFFLHVIPVNGEDLPEHRRQSGFDNLDFPFDQNGVLTDERCVAKVDLPDYDIVGVRTGQYIRQGGQFINPWSQESIIPRTSQNS